MNGLREFRLSSLKSKAKPPCHLSAPGCVKISMPFQPGNSFSAENGLLFMRTSRIASFGGICPFEKPSTLICAFPPPRDLLVRPSPVMRPRVPADRLAALQVLVRAGRWRWRCCQSQC